MNNPDPSVSCLLAILFSLVTLAASLAEQYFLSLNENKLDYAVKQSLSTARFLHAINERRLPRLGDTIWFARYFSLSCLVLFSSSLIYWGFSSGLLRLMAIGALALLIALLLTVLPRFLQIRFKRKHTGQLFFSLQITVYLVFALPTVFSISILRFIMTRIFGSITKTDLLIPIRRTRSAAQIGNSIQEKVEPEVTLLQNALDFSKVRVRDCMVPRNEIVAIDIESDIEELTQKFVETHFSKILIYKETSDNLVGYVHSYELFKKPQSIRNILLPVFMVPETLNAQEVFELFVKQNRSIAVVVDEFGGTSGMVTIEDVIEEIFGEIDDEHDISHLTEQRIEKDRYLFSGRLEIDYLNEKYGLDIPESENYDTLAGFVVDQLEDIPEANACFETEQFLITVTRVTEARIELLDLKVKEAS